MKSKKSILLVAFSFLSCSVIAQYNSEKSFDSTKNNLFFFIDDIKGPWMGYYDTLKSYDTIITGYLFHYENGFPFMMVLYKTGIADSVFKKYEKGFRKKDPANLELTDIIDYTEIHFIAQESRAQIKNFLTLSQIISLYKDTLSCILNGRDYTHYRLETYAVNSYCKNHNLKLTTKTFCQYEQSNKEYQFGMCNEGDNLKYLHERNFIIYRSKSNE